MPRRLTRIGFAKVNGPITGGGTTMGNSPVDREGLAQTAHGRLVWVRAFNGVAGLFPPKTGDVDTMLRSAERRAKFSDWGPTNFREGLDLLVKGFNEDDQLHPLGRKLIYDSYVDRLVQRLQVVQAVAAQPRIAAQEVTAPVLIGGLPRTGTTLLHRVLARDPRLRGPLGWETEEPVPPPHPESADTDPRAKKFDRTWGRMYRLAPRAEAIHFKSSKLADECYPLLERSFTCVNKALFSAQPEYEQWLWSATPATIDASYTFYRQQLQLLQLHYPPRRWVLKAPAHAPFLDGFARAFPDARIIYTHRDPVTLVASVASLFTAVRSIGYRRIDPEEIGAQSLDVIDAMTGRIMRARATMPASCLFDVEYERLTRDTISVLGEIYGFIGLEFDNDMQAQAQQWLAATAAEKRGEHRYDLRDFGLDQEIIRRRLREYIDVSHTWL
jgi:hypothetical protein